MENFKHDIVEEVKMEDEYGCQPSTSLYDNEQDYDGTKYAF
jgi:hypothetical protein